MVFSLLLYQAAPIAALMAIEGRQGGRPAPQGGRSAAEDGRA
jgi:hypothetical protein